MALKTGYKVNNTEIVLDDCSGYIPPDGVNKDTIKDKYTEPLEGYYKVNDEYIKAFKYIEGKGQILAELPGYDYYKSPSDIRYALYGTSTVGGWVEGKKSKYLQQYDNTFKDEVKYVDIGFDGTRIGELSLDSIGSGHYMSKPLYSYEYSPLGIIKVWCMAVASGGGGGVTFESRPYGSGGGGGATALLCIHLKPYDMLHVEIPPCSMQGNRGKDLIISLYKGTWDAAANGKTLLTGGGGSEGINATYSSPVGALGGTFQVIEDVQLKYSKLEAGSRGGGGSSDPYESEGKSANTLSTLTDYTLMCESKTNLGGIGRHSATSLQLGGGGASAFPGGNGGCATGIIYAGPGGGGGAVAAGDLLYSGGGAFWLLYA